MAFELNIIVAVGSNLTKDGYPIGRNGKLPWYRCAEDLAWFKEVTMGHPIIMGRKTYESIGRLLPGRLNIIISRKSDLELPKYEKYGDGEGVIVKSFEEAISIAVENGEKAFIIGGGSIYKYAIENDYVDNIYIDELNIEVEDADTFFPDFKAIHPWQKVGRRIEIVKDFAYASVYERERGRNNKVDNQYLNLIQDILKNGTEKDTRAGKTLSLFSRQMRFNLKNGLPMLTTKKMFSKGVIHELLWFIKGDTNIKYLVENGVHIWDDDAYRYYIELLPKLGEKYVKNCSLSKEEFINRVLADDVLYSEDGVSEIYKLGDLGPVYGFQWRNWNGVVDQLQDVIYKLKNNPDDRRIMLSAWNVSDIPDMALPPCHYCCQFYAKEMTLEERRRWYWKHITCIGSQNVTVEIMDEINVPKRKLSCMWNQRSVDVFLGLPFNILSYAILTHMIAHCVNMDVDELIFNGGDVHIYLNQMDAINEQLKRNPHKYRLPKLWLNNNIKDIDGFSYKDIVIDDYNSYPTIKAPLSVGLK